LARSCHPRDFARDWFSDAMTRKLLGNRGSVKIPFQIFFKLSGGNPGFFGLERCATALHVRIANLCVRCTSDNKILNLIHVYCIEYIIDSNNSTYASIFKNNPPSTSASGKSVSEQKYSPHLNITLIYCICFIIMY